MSSTSTGEKAPVDLKHSYDTQSQERRQSVIRGGESPGVARVEAISSVITHTDRIFIFFGVFLIAYVYGLDGTLRYVYQPTATASFAQHSLLATVNVLRAVIAAAAQPTTAKLADVFGRVELICLSLLFYIVGTIVEATSNGVNAFCAGAVIYQIGYTMIIFLLEVVIADITSTRARLLFSYIPALPFIINTWVSGDISSATLKRTSWHWGVGMWAIIYPVAALPLIISLFIVSRRAKRLRLLVAYKTPFQQHGFKGLAVDLFWHLDVIGIILLIAVFALILTPLTIASGLSNKWKQAHVIAPLVVGILCIPVFILWELRSPHPLAPFSLMKDRGVWGPLGIALFLNFAWGMQADYLYTVLIVAFNFSIAGATRVVSLYSFTSTITGFLLGFVVYLVRRLKVFIVAGTCIYMVAFGLLIHYRGDHTNSAKAGVIGAEVLLGFAGGMFPYPAQASLQVSLKHEHLALMTGLYLATYNIGSALGNTVSGAVWTNTLYKKLEKNLAFQSNTTLAAATYGDPFTVVAAFPVGTLEREAIIRSYQSVQKLLCIVGICLCVPLLAFAIVLRNPKLNDDQTLHKSSEEDEQGLATTTGIHGLSPTSLPFLTDQSRPGDSNVEVAVHLPHALSVGLSTGLMDTTPAQGPSRRPQSTTAQNDGIVQIDSRRKFRRRDTDSLSEYRDSGSDDGSVISMSDSEELELEAVASDFDDEETGLTGETRKIYLEQKRRKNNLASRIAGGDSQQRHSVSSKDAQREADRNVIRNVVFNAVLITLWYAFSLSISIYNKWMFSGDHLNFPFPLFTTSLHMVVQFFLASAVLIIFPRFRPVSPSSTTSHPKPLITPGFYLTRLIPCGTTTSLDIGLGNTSLRYITLTFYTMCKSSVLIFVLAFALLFRLEKPSFVLITTIMTMALGVLLMVYGETAFHALGFALAMSASFFSGFRWALTQILLLRHPATSNPFATLFFLAPIMFFTLLVIALIAEGPSEIIVGLSLLIHDHGIGTTLALLIIPGSLAFFMIASEFTLLQRTSVVTLSICGIFKEVVTISAAGIVFHDELSVVNISGLLVTISCIACYNYLKVTKMREEARRRLEKRDDDRYGDNGTEAVEPLMTVMNGRLHRSENGDDVPTPQFHPNSARDPAPAPTASLSRQ
ncbi:hypothetical protein DV736_g1252, partial [Chaetothyriales sp. CBS 134916]